MALLTKDFDCPAIGQRLLRVGIPSVSRLLFCHQVVLQLLEMSGEVIGSGTSPTAATFCARSKGSPAPVRLFPSICVELCRRLT